MGKDDVERKPASENPWYVLMTIAGEQEGSHSWDINFDLTKANRRFWHGWLSTHLSDEVLVKLITEGWIEDSEVEELTPREWEILRRRFFDARLETPTSPLSLIDMEELIFEKMFSAEGFLFPFMFGVQCSRFLRPVRLSECKFMSLTDFKDCEFQSSFEAQNNLFGRVATWRRAHFREVCDLKGNQFSGRVLFQDAKFEASTSFTKAAFHDRVPEFYNTNLHEDTVWNEVAWPPPPANKTESIEHLRAYERLKLIMDGQKKTHDEQMFHRMELRCREVEEGFPKNVPSRLYGLVAEYGWSFVRPAVCLAATAVLGFLWMAIWFSVEGACPVALGGPELADCGWQALGVSVSNTFGFLGLGRVVLGDEVKALSEFGWFEIGAGVQFFLGPVFLFFLFLALRNRYRMR